MTCGRKMRTGECQMDSEHRGRCSTVTFQCDLCGQVRRGQPAYVEREEGIGVCWFCMNLAPRAERDESWAS